MPGTPSVLGTPHLMASMGKTAGIKLLPDQAPVNVYQTPLIKPTNQVRKVSLEEALLLDPLSQSKDTPLMSTQLIGRMPQPGMRGGNPNAADDATPVRSKLPAASVSHYL